MDVLIYHWGYYVRVVVLYEYREDNWWGCLSAVAKRDRYGENLGTFKKAWQEGKLSATQGHKAAGCCEI